MKKILLLLTLISFSAISQNNPALFRSGIETIFTKYRSYTTAERDALTLASTDRRIIHHLNVSPAVNQYEQWDGDSWEELGGTSEWAGYTGTRAGGNLLLNLGDYDDSFDSFKLILDQANGYVRSNSFYSRFYSVEDVGDIRFEKNGWDIQLKHNPSTTLTSAGFLYLPNLSGLVNTIATQEWVTAQGFSTSSPFIDSSGFVESPDFYSYLDFRVLDNGLGRFDLKTDSGTGQDFSRFYNDLNTTSLTNFKAGKFGLLGVHDGVFEVEQSDGSGAIVSTLKFTTPTASSDYLIPNKAVSGIYTLATTDDISAPTTINNTLTSTATDEALSANMGKTLKDVQDIQQTEIDNLEISDGNNVKITGDQTIDDLKTFTSPPILELGALLKPFVGSFVFNPTGGSFFYGGTSKYTFSQNNDDLGPSAERYATFDFSNLTGATSSEKVYEFPDESGTIALTTDIPTAINAENVIVSPSIGGETDAYAVMLANRTSIDSIQANMVSGSNTSGINSFDKQTFIATASQTVFTLSDSPNKVNVIVNGDIKTEVTDYTYDVGVVTFLAGLTASDVVVVNKHYFNTDIVSAEFLLTNTVTPQIEGSVILDGFWGTGGTLGTNTGFSAFPVLIPAVAGDKFIVVGLVTGALPVANYGRLVNSSGTVIGSALANTNYSQALGGRVLTVPATSGVAGILLNFPDASVLGSVDDIKVYRGSELIYEDDIFVNSNRINKNDKISAIANSYYNYNTEWFANYNYGASGLPAFSSGNSALRESIPVTEGQSIIFKGITFSIATNYFRVFNSSDTFLASLSSNDLKDIAFGKKLTVNTSGAAYIKLWIPTAQVSTTNEIYLAESFLEVNQIKEESLRNKNALAVANSGYFERGLNGEPTVPTTVAIEIIGQSQFDGRIPIADYPAYYTSASNTLPGVLICDTGTGVFTTYGDAQQKTVSATQRFGLDLYLYKKIHDEVAADCYFIKTTLGGTSLYHLGEGAGRWTPDFAEIGGLRKMSLEQRDAYVAAADGASSSFVTNISAIIFMQGESDRAYPEFYYETMLKKIMYDRGVKNNPDLPYILCGVSSSSTQYSYDVELQKQQLANDLRNVYYVAAPTGTGNLQADVIHFNATGGEIFAESIKDLLITIGVI